MIEVLIYRIQYDILYIIIEIRRFLCRRCANNHIADVIAALTAPNRDE